MGPYEILSALGRGGMGEVHRARHRETGELVALKTVRGARASTLESLRREIHALARLSHPGIVRIVGEGTQDGLPWYAMELLEGRTLRQHAAARAAGALAETEQVWREWWTTQLDAAPATARLDKAAPAPVREGGRADVAEVLAVGARVCEPLAYLHGEGLVHRDLKPENVLVRDDGTTVIVDFGLSSRFGGVVGRDQLEATDLHVGTPVYMSPEQVMGRVVDARSDLYSLGCVLYELLTGRPPFLDQPLAVLQMHVHATPEPPSRLASGIPETLDTLLLRLLAKDPRERMGYADDVARRLREIASPESRVHAAGVRPRAYLYRAALVGRAAPMAALRGALDGLGEGRRAAVLLGGASGAGKTRMLTELVQEARFRGVDVLAGACANDEPLGCLRVPLRAIGDACRERGPGAVDSVLGRHARILARFEGSLAALPGVASMPEPADLPPDAARLRLALALSDTFASAARERPLVLALDDLHDADDLTLAFLEVHLRRGVRDGRLLVAGSYRSDEPRERLAALAGMACVTSVILPPLSPEEVEALAAEMLALDRSPRGLGRLLARQSEGNPLFVAEYLRLAVAEGLLYRDEEGVWRISDAPERDGLRDGREDLPLPTSLRELLSRRLARLGPAASRMLAWAAVLGREPEGAVLARLGGDAGDALAGLRELLTAEVLEPTAAGYRFTHDAIRTLVHDGLSDLPSRHREAALAIEGEHPEREPWLAALGWHWQGAGDVARALPCYLAAARRAVSMFALEEAERLLGAYLALAPAPTEDRVEARRILGQEVLVRRGRHREAEELLRRAVEEAREVGDLAAEAGARRALGLVVNDLGRPAEAVACLEEARELATRAGDVSTQATVTGTLALMHVEQGRLDIAWDLHAEAREIMERAGDRRIEAALVGNMGIAHAERGRMDLAEPLFLRALDAARALGDRRHEGLVQGNLAGLRYRQGRIEEAKGHFEKALAIARETTDLKYEAITRGNIGNLLLDEGRVEEARLMYEGAHAILRSIGIRRNEAILLMGIGAAHQALGRPAEAGGCYREALEIARAVADRFTEARVLGNHARLLAVEGRLDEAEAMFGESLAIARETSDRRFEGIVQAGLASLALLARADVVEAERLGREAERLLQEATDQKELARLGCLLGLVAIARGESAEGHLASARAHAIELRAAPGSLLARDIEVLERAERARAAGQALVAGRSPADLSPGEARWLTSRA